MPRRLACGVALVPAVVLLATSALVLPVARFAAACRPVLPVRARAVARLFCVLAIYLFAFEVPALLGALRESGGRNWGGQISQLRRCPRCKVHYRRLLARFFGFGLSTAGMRVRRDPGHATVPTDRPLIVIVRHAGLLNAQLFAHIVFEDLGRTPRTVGRRAVRADIGHAVFLDHLPMVLFRFNRAGRAGARAALADLGRSTTPGDAVVIAPEGANFTAGRRVRAISRLTSRGLHHEAAQAAQRIHTLPPNPGGVRTLLASLPAADVVLLAHTGLEALLPWTTRRAYRPPGHDTLHVTWWHVPAEHIPTDRAAQDTWLLEWWGRIDQWVTDPNDQEGTHR
ncbi:1-acyl-sn-glycerol-3-phosphate acyltransferase [Streptomyces sp. NPDC051554]|uniref:1-acyl-sn-glycerol-3-phosphate acyltransferase n=1 Tax=Streptomyces sp. NPDC051554 TaxID=3365656 RepID=UPI0037B9962A